MRGEQWRVALIAGGTVVAAGALLLLAARRSGRLGGASRQLAGSSEERETLLAVLRELSRRFFHVCQDTAAIAKTVRAKIEAARVAITDDKLKEQLTLQCKVFEKLSEIELEVMRQHGCTREGVEVLQRQFAKDPEVRCQTEGFRAMLEDALSGAMPVLPGVRIPSWLTEEKALQILAAVHEAEVKKAEARLAGGKRGLQELGEALHAVQREAWEETFRSEAAGGLEVEVYHSAVALFLRNEDFAKERQRLDEARQKRMVKIMRPGGRQAA